MRVIKSLVVAHSWFNSYAPELVPIFYYRNKTRVQMFYVLIKAHVIIVKVLNSELIYDSM